MCFELRAAVYFAASVRACAARVEWFAVSPDNVFSVCFSVASSISVMVGCVCECGCDYSLVSCLLVVAWHNFSFFFLSSRLQSVRLCDDAWGFQ